MHLPCEVAESPSPASRIILAVPRCDAQGTSDRPQVNLTICFSTYPRRLEALYSGCGAAMRGILGQYGAVFRFRRQILQRISHHGRCICCRIQSLTLDLSRRGFGRRTWGRLRHWGNKEKVCISGASLQFRPRSPLPSPRQVLNTRVYPQAGAKKKLDLGLGVKAYNGCLGLTLVPVAWGSRKDESEKRVENDRDQFRKRRRSSQKTARRESEKRRGHESETESSESENGGRTAPTVEHVSEHSFRISVCPEPDPNTGSPEARIRSSEALSEQGIRSEVARCGSA